MGETINPFQPKGNFGLWDGPEPRNSYLRLMGVCLKKRWLRRFCGRVDMNMRWHAESCPVSEID